MMWSRFGLIGPPIGTQDDEEEDDFFDDEDDVGETSWEDDEEQDEDDLDEDDEEDTWQVVGRAYACWGRTLTSESEVPRLARS